MRAAGSRSRWVVNVRIQKITFQEKIEYRKIELIEFVYLHFIYTFILLILQLSWRVNVMPSNLRRDVSYCAVSAVVGGATTILLGEL